MTGETQPFFEVCNRCDGFFYEPLKRAIQKQGVEISDEAVFYLLVILNAGMYFQPYEDGNWATDVYRQAMEVEKSKAPDLLQRLGDMSLVLCGIWWQSLVRKLVDPEYYINIGRFGYREAARMRPNSSLNPILTELSDNFVGSVDVFMEVTSCISEAFITNRRILETYHTWLSTRSSFLEKRLRDMGIDTRSLSRIRH